MLKNLTTPSRWRLGRTLQEIYRPQHNAFDLLRFLLASSVIVFHSYILSGSSEVDPLARLTRGQSNLGEFAVSGFFAISGFLITQSLLNSRTIGRYFWKRMLRLMPALLASLILSALILGPFITSQGAWEYFFGNQGVSPWRSIFLNATLNIFGFSYAVRDLFAHNPYPVAVNGSLWTLKHEFASYVILALLGSVGVFKRPRVLLLFTGFIGAAYMLIYAFDINLVSGLTTTWWIFHAVEYPYFLMYFWMFLMGSILFVYREQIPAHPAIPFILALLLGASIPLGYFHYAWLVIAPYLIILTAISLPLSWFSKYGDFSYGIYVYAFPVQQTLVFLLYPHIGPKRLMLYAFVVTLLISIVSWYLVEKPALNLKSHNWNALRGGRKASSPQSDVQPRNADEQQSAVEPVDQLEQPS